MRQKEEVKYKLVFAIVKNDVFTWMLEPYAVQVMKSGMFAYNHQRISSNNVLNYIKELSEEEETAIRLLDDCRADAINRIFGQNKFRSGNFVSDLHNNSSLLRMVIAYLREKTDQAIQVLAKAKIPLHFKGEKADLINEEPIIPVHEKLKFNFNFSLNEEGLVYTIKTSLDGRTLNLTEENTLILNYDPCWLIHKGQFIQAADNVDGKKLQPFLSKDTLLIPQSQTDAYLSKFVKHIVGQYPFKLEGMTHSYWDGTPKARLEIENSLQNRPALVLHFAYDTVLYRYASEAKYHVDLKKEKGQYHFRIVQRNQDFEKEIKSWLLDNGLIHISGSSFQFFETEFKDNDKKKGAIFDIISLVNLNRDVFSEKGIDIVYRHKQDYFTGKIELKQQFIEDADWFDLKIYVMFDDLRIPFSALKKNIVENNREFLLPNGNIAILPAEWFSKFRDLALISDSDGEEIRVKKSQFNYIKPFLTENSRIDNFIENSTKGHIPLQEKPLSFIKTLRPYQLRGMSWFMYLHENNFGGCLSDDMGLGKTIQVLAFIQKIKELSEDSKNEGRQMNLFSKNSKGTSLIVMPLSLIHNWEEETRSTAPELKVMRHTGIHRRFSKEVFSNHDIILTTYGVVRNDIEKLSSFDFKFIFLDESQYIKNPESKIFHAVSRLKAEQRFVLTGTPIENSLLDLWSQLTFVNPGLLGDLRFFRNKFYQPIEKHGSESSEKKFHQIINPFILRRTKAAVAPELPNLTEKIHYCTMTEEQSELYEKRKSEIRNYILEGTQKYGMDKMYMVILSGLMRLRLIANHPIINEKDYTGESGKFNEVKENIEKVIGGGHKTLIFSQFVKHLSIYKSYLESKNIPHLMLTGQSSAQNREKMIHAFQTTNDFPVFLISLKAGGVGLNLTAADFVFMLDPWWNPAVEQQAINRTHRIGQDKKVISYKFITQDTIEEKILALQQKKTDLFNTIINNKTVKSFSEEQIHELLS
ncbi:MAG: DEAD/DEAH box helicase [Bacteroidales bacterium]|nr:DEAD/DEAH box helicase [Bacteroidales bacterium]